jgi:hypothetical protein
MPLGHEAKLLDSLVDRLPTYHPSRRFFGGASQQQQQSTGSSVAAFESSPAAEIEALHTATTATNQDQVAKQPSKMDEELPSRNKFYCSRFQWLWEKGALDRARAGEGKEEGVERLWIYDGRLYDLGPYLDKHPGGRGKQARGRHRAACVRACGLCVCGCGWID